MAIYERLTDRTLATGVTLNDFVHVVITGDTSQNVAGSSYKATIQQIANAITGTTGSSGTSGTSGAGDGQFLPLSGGTVTGNTFFGITSGITIDQTNIRIGLGTDTPEMPLDIRAGQGRLTFTGSTGGFLEMSGSTDLPRFQVTIPPYLTKPIATLQLAIRSWDNATRPGYGQVGDGILYASNELNGLNIMNRQGTGTEDYIKFYAGQDANGTTADIMIVGSGATRGYVGFGTETPTEKLDVNGNAIIQNDFTASTVNISSTPTTDTSLSANYLTRDSSTGDVKIKQIPGPTVYGLFSQTGNSVTVSATTTETSIIDGGIGTLSVPSNNFTIGDSFRADIAGVLNAANNETIQVRVKSGSVILLDTGPQTLPIVSNDVWTMSINFTIRQIGGSGVASIVSLGAFHYTKLSTGNVEGFSFNTVNNTTFDTTVSNTLDITVEWGSTNAANSIYSDIFVLNKIF